MSHYWRTRIAILGGRGSYLAMILMKKGEAANILPLEVQQYKQYNMTIVFGDYPLHDAIKIS